MRNQGQGLHSHFAYDLYVVCLHGYQVSVYRTIGPLVYYLFYRFLSQQVRVGGGNKNKIHLDYFPIE